METLPRYSPAQVPSTWQKKLHKVWCILGKDQFRDLAMARSSRVSGKYPRRYVFLVQSTFSPAENIMELLLMIDAARRASAYKVIAVIPYYGYARQDRKDKPRVAIGSKLVANMLVAAGADRVITMDLHAPQIQGYFDIPVDHLDSSAIFIPYIEQLKLENLTFAAPDVGSANRIREIASYFNAEMVICDKHRKRANEIASMVVIGDVTDRDVVLIDDICDTGGTLGKSGRSVERKGRQECEGTCARTRF